MSKVFHFICIICASLSLVACSYFDTEQPSLESKVPEGSETPQEFQYSTGGVAPNLSEAVYTSTDGSVEIFSLEDGVAHTPVPPSIPLKKKEAFEPPPVKQSSEPLISAHYPNVEIYPFEGMINPLERITPPPRFVQPVRLEPPTRFTPPAKPENFELVPPPETQPVSFETAPALPILPAGQNKVVVHFAGKAIETNHQDYEKISEIAQAFNASATSAPIRVEGYADIVGNYESAAQKQAVNIKISMDRAFAVADRLREYGVPAGAIQVKGWGDSR